jgi:hypothetical protein
MPRQAAVKVERLVAGAHDGISGPLDTLAAQLGGVPFRRLGPRVGFDVADGGGAGQRRVHRFLVSAEAVEIGNLAGGYSPDAEQGRYVPGIFAGAGMAGSEKDALIHAEFDSEGFFVRAV